MKNIFVKILISVAILISFQGGCIKVEFDNVENKSKILHHNFIVVNSSDGTPAQVEVSYAVFVEGNNENIVKTQTLITPFVIGGEAVKVVYDSINKKFNGKVKDSFFELKRNYSPKGADFLLLKNLSNIALEYAVLGNQPLEYYSERELNDRDFSNINEINRVSVVKKSPTPIYKGVPVLYLLKPELAPQQEVYIPWVMGKCNADICALGAVEAKMISLKTPFFGEVVADVPFSISDIISLYRAEYKSGYYLYGDYSKYRKGQISSVNESIVSNKEISHYGVIPAGQELSNQGQVWFVNMHFGSYGIDVM